MYYSETINKINANANSCWEGQQQQLTIKLVYRKM